MKNVIIENPILNSPYREPIRHWKFSDDGITDEIVDGRRVSAYFIPIAKPRSRGTAAEQLTFQSEWTQDRIEENRFINEVRRHVAAWREAGWPHTTRMTRRLLDWWTAPGRDNRLFFCQIEALETAIFIAEAAPRLGNAWLETELRQAMNKLEYPQDARFSDAFLVVTPGITIRDRLRVLLPNDPQNYYRMRDLVPPERVAAGRLTKAMLGRSSGGGAFTATYPTSSRGSRTGTARRIS